MGSNPWEKSQEQQDREQRDYRQFQQIQVDKHIAEIASDQLEVDRQNLRINRRRDFRERCMLWVAVASVAVSVGSLWIAGLALKVACLPK